MRGFSAAPNLRVKTDSLNRTTICTMPYFAKLYPGGI